MTREERQAVTAYRNDLQRSAESALQDLLRRARQDNAMISPWSLAECAGIARLAAGGETEKDFALLLHSTQTSVEAAVSSSKLRASFDQLEESGILLAENSLWMDHKFPLKPQFIQDCMKWFDSKPEQTTFPEPALSQINDRVREATRGTIPKLFSEFNPPTVMVLVNAVSFQDTWAGDLTAKPKARESFTLESGEVVQVPMVYGEGKFSAFHLDGAEVLDLPYQSGLFMRIVLPARGTSPLQWVENHQGWLSKNRIHSPPREGTIQFPKWSSSYRWDLMEYMTSQGWPNPFSANADFSGIGARKGEVWVAQFLQRTAIEVDEKGTRAAAATGMEMTAKGDMGLLEPINFVADRPFLYTILDRAGTPYFVGVLNDPRS